jgi:hypothetical protein
VQGSLVDPTTLVTWGLRQDGKEARVGGTIHRQDGHQQPFWDKETLRPYLDAWCLKRDELLPPAKTHGCFSFFARV